MTALIRAGKVCATCAAGHCRDEGTPDEPHEIDCPECEGRGCPGCDGGSLQITGCPQRLVDASMRRLVKYSDLMFRGLPPTAGGALDQENWFLEAAQRLKHEEDRLIPPI